MFNVFIDNRKIMSGAAARTGMERSNKNKKCIV